MKIEIKKLTNGDSETYLLTAHVENICVHAKTCDVPKDSTLAEILKKFLDILASANF